MTSAEDFKRFRHAIATLAQAMKPDDADPYAQERKLIQYHLQVAAGRTRALAEALAKQEGAA